MEKTQETAYWQRFKKLLLSLETAAQVDAFCTAFFTPDECTAMAGRVAIFKSLLEGQTTQRTMAKDLNLSIAKITRGSNELKKAGDDFKAWLLKQME